MDIAQALESGRLVGGPKMALVGIGSELGEENVLQGAILAARQGVDVVYIGTKKSEGLSHVKAGSEDEARQIMEKMLDEGLVSGAVTMHYPFPIGVATVGRAVIPANGREMFIATTTGTASSDRVEAMVLGAITGVIAAKACGQVDPSLGILNIEGARQTEMILKKLIENGYPIRLASSMRLDGGCLMRGNDVLSGSPDILVTDSLTGNLVIKMLSGFASGGQYESLGYGYGPGIGEHHDRLVLIVSRASGAAVISGALQYGAALENSNYKAIAAKEYTSANKAGLKELLKKNVDSRKAITADSPPAAPAAEAVTMDIAGIDVMDLDSAVSLLWRQGIYAQSGMGCTGPIVLVSDTNLTRAVEALKKGGFIS
ncbi:MAG: glycine reductase [Clostridiales bacterium]|nr:glycine reductase [Clostridiales bacterium]